MRSSDLILNDELIDGRYQVVSELGTGSYGTVYLAHDREMDRQVAVKVLRGVFAADWARGRTERFLREGKALARLMHKGIVVIKRIALLPDGRPYLVMEFIDGEPLQRVIAGAGTLSCKQATEICTQIAETLAYAHKQGIVHRDVKPQNIMITQEGAETHARILDFGLSSLQDSSPSGSGNKLTMSGVLVGTPAYMSPEQCLGTATDARTDIYSFGCVFFEMLTGRAPYSDNDPLSTMWNHTHSSLPKLADVDPQTVMPPLLQNILDKATRREPDERYANFDEMLADLRSPALLSSDARIDPARAWEKKKRSSLPGATKTVVFRSLAISAAISCVVFAALLSNSTVAAGVISVVAGVSPPAAQFVARQLAGAEQMLFGPASVDTLAQSTFAAKGITELSYLHRVELGIAFIDAIGDQISPDRDWQVILPTFEYAFEGLRDVRADGRTPRVALGRIAEIIHNGPMSAEHWADVMHRLNESDIISRHLMKEQPNDLYQRLVELRAAAFRYAAGPDDDIRAIGTIRWYVELCMFHIYDKADQPFDTYAADAEAVAARHPGLLKQAANIHNTKAERYRKKGNLKQAAVEAAKSAELMKRIQETPEADLPLYDLGRVRGARPGTHPLSH